MLVISGVSDRAEAADNEQSRYGDSLSTPTSIGGGAGGALAMAAAITASISADVGGA